MPNYYTLIYLKDELKRNILGARFTFAISPHKNVLECYLKNEEGLSRLIFSADASETALYLDDFRPPKKQNVFEFFDALEGKKIIDITLAKFDRLMTLQFENKRSLLFKLFGHRANVFLINDGTIVDAFKQPEEVKGEPAPQARPPTFNQSFTAAAKPKNQLTKINPLLPRNLLPALIKQHNVDAMSVEEVKTFTKKITGALLNEPHYRVLETGDVCLWSQYLLNLPTEKSFDTVNNALRFAYQEAVHLRRLHQKKERVILFLERTVKKKQAELEQLQQADKSLERAGKYEKWGNLLMAHAHETVEAGTKKIDVKDIYKDGARTSIDLKEDLSIAGNAEHYYKKAKSSRTSYKKAKSRIPKVKHKVRRAHKLLEEVHQIDRLYKLEKWIKAHEKPLEKYGYGTSDEGQAKSPFRKFKEGTYEIWIGKNAKSNDKLTRTAHKEDIWLHARGVAGSHAVIRMGNQKAYPPQKVLLRAASYAAYYSKAKGVKTAPVMYTKCKYVYKPSGADPGAVVAKREEVVMVPPMKPN